MYFLYLWRFKGETRDVTEGVIVWKLTNIFILVHTVSKDLNVVCFGVYNFMQVFVERVAITVITAVLPLT